MHHFLYRLMTFLLALALIPFAAGLAEEKGLTPLFEAALTDLQTPAQFSAELNYAPLHPGDTAYVPYLLPEVIPFDEREKAAPPAANGTFESTDESVVTVDETGLMTAVAPGDAAVIYHAEDGAWVLTVNVSDDNLPELIKNYLYVLKREFYTMKRESLPRPNQYENWYYRKRNPVGWCSVFTVYCANAAGVNPIDEELIDPANIPMVQFYREGQVGNQYDCFMKTNRFTNIPKPGYLVIYAEMNDLYRTTHIASVIDVQDRGDGVYAVTTIEGNMSQTVKSYCYLYDSKLDNHLVGAEKTRKLHWNMSELPESERTDPLIQYTLHTDHWSVFGFGQTWE